MNKISRQATNVFCPQTLFLYGTCKEDRPPYFGLFCWFSYYWDGEFGVMMSILNWRSQEAFLSMMEKFSCAEYAMHFIMRNSQTKKYPSVID